MDPFLRTCEVCLAVVRVWDMEAHLGWHRTLTNVPRSTT